jgi:hypothetical protein
VRPDGDPLLKEWFLQLLDGEYEQITAIDRIKQEFTDTQATAIKLPAGRSSWLQLNDLMKGHMTMHTLGRSQSQTKYADEQFVLQSKLAFQDAVKKFQATTLGENWKPDKVKERFNKAVRMMPPIFRVAIPPPVVIKGALEVGFNLDDPVTVSLNDEVMAAQCDGVQAMDPKTEYPAFVSTCDKLKVQAREERLVEITDAQMNLAGMKKAESPAVQAARAAQTGLQTDDKALLHRPCVVLTAYSEELHAASVAERKAVKDEAARAKKAITAAKAKATREAKKSVEQKLKTAQKLREKEEKKKAKEALAVTKAIEQEKAKAAATFRKAAYATARKKSFKQKKPNSAVEDDQCCNMCFVWYSQLLEAKVGDVVWTWCETCPGGTKAWCGDCMPQQSVVGHQAVCGKRNK